MRPISSFTAVFSPVHLAGGNVLLDGVEQLGQLGSEGADDGRRGLVGTETVVVAGTGDGGAQHIGGGGWRIVLTKNAEEAGWSSGCPA